MCRINVNAALNIGATGRTPILTLMRDSHGGSIVLTMKANALCGTTYLRYIKHVPYPNNTRRVNVIAAVLNIGVTNRRREVHCG